MHIFSFYVEDDRYRAPGLQFVPARDELAARRLAHAKLAESAHHVSVEVREDDRLVFRLVTGSSAADVQQNSA